MEEEVIPESEWKRTGPSGSVFFFANGSPAFAGNEYSLNPSLTISDRNGRKKTEEEGQGTG